MERAILGVTLRDKIRNKKIRRRANITDHRINSISKLKGRPCIGSVMCSLQNLQPLGDKGSRVANDALYVSPHSMD